MRTWRVARQVFPALDGEGARLHGGRWNHPGTPVVYTAESRALAILERLPGTDLDDLPDDFYLFEIETPNNASVETVTEADIGPAWHRPRHEGCRDIGTEWAASRRSLILAVPSVIVPEEHNYLINPRHPGASEVRLAANRPFRFDDRLFR